MATLSRAVANVDDLWEGDFRRILVCAGSEFSDVAIDVALGSCGRDATSDDNCLKMTQNLRKAQTESKCAAVNNVRAYIWAN